MQPTPTTAAIPELPDVDPVRVYATLAAVEDPEPVPYAVTLPRLPEAPEVLAGLATLGELEDAAWTDVEGEGADYEALVQRYEGLDVEELEALAQYGEQALPDVEDEGGDLEALVI